MLLTEMGLLIPYIAHFETSVSQLAVKTRNSTPWPLLLTDFSLPQLHSALEDLHLASLHSKNMSIILSDFSNVSCDLHGITPYFETKKLLEAMK